MTAFVPNGCILVQMYILAPKMDIIAPKIYILAPKMHISPKFPY